MREPVEVELVAAADEARLKELAKLQKQFDWALDNPMGQPQQVSTAQLQRMGELLWQLSGLDAAAVREQLEEAMEEQVALRLTVLQQEQLHLPWELLRHPDPQLGFLAQQPWCNISRRVAGRGNKTPKLLPRPLKILLFVAAPEDLDPERGRLNYEQEEELLFSALDERVTAGEVEIEVAADGCLSTLQRHLADTQYHAVILSMHGAPAQSRAGQPEWGLLFEAEEGGEGRPLAGSELARELEELPAGRPGLVVLGACRSARLEGSAEETGQEPSAEGDGSAEQRPSAEQSSVALALHRAGFERVLGMRLSVLDGAMSAFDAKFFGLLAEGMAVGRAVSLARRQLAAGKCSEDGDGTDPLAQWVLPVLLDRSVDGPLLDRQPLDRRPRDSALPDASRSVPLRPAPKPDELIAGDRTLSLPQRGEFIGRRRVIRRHLRGFLSGETPRLHFVGPGGVGKTTLAGWFARVLMERQRSVRVLGFRAPFDMDSATLEEQLREQAFDGQEAPALLAAVQSEQERPARIELMLRSLAGRQDQPCAFILDNLEVLQELETLAVKASAASSLRFIQLICGLPAPTRVLLTGRYALSELGARVQPCPVSGAPYGDVLRRMTRLKWPAGWSAEDKRSLYQRLGGNHRALEWLAHLLGVHGARAGEELLRELEQQQAPPQTPAEAEAVVLEGMRQNLLLERLLASLTPADRQLLQRAALYRAPVTEDGLTTLEEPEQGQQEDSASVARRQRLIARSLLDATRDVQLELDFYEVPPLIRQLLAEPDSHSAEQAALHAKMAHYHEYQGAHVTRRWTDRVEAVHHYRRGALHTDADRLAEGLASFYYSRANFTAALALALEIVPRAAPAPPWWAYNRAGMCWQVLGELVAALEAHERAEKGAPDLRSRGTTLNNLSQIYDAKGDYDTALTYLQQSLQIQRDIGDKKGEGTTLNNLSQIYNAQGDYDTALTYLQQSLQIRRDIGDKKGEGTTLNNLATTAHAKGDYDTALTYLQQSLQIQRDIGDKKGEGTTLNNLATTAHAKGDYDTALTYLQQSLQIQRDIGDKKGEGTTLNNLSQIYKARGDYDTALTYLQQSLQIRRDIGDKKGEGTTLNNLSQIYDAKGDYDTALTYLQQSLQIQRDIGDKNGEGTTLNNLATTAHAKGDYDTALTYLQQSLQIQRDIGDKNGEGTTLNNLSQIYDAKGDYDTALTYLQQSLQIQRDVGDKKGEGTTLNNLATTAHAKGDYDTALTYLQQSLQIQRDIGDKNGEGTTLNNLSQIYNARGDYATALTYLQQSLQIQRDIGDKKGEGTTLNNLSQIYNARGDYATALTYLQQSLQIQRDIGDKSGEGTTLNNLATTAHAKGDYATALTYLQQSLQIQRDIGDKKGEGTTLNNLSQIYNAQGDYDTALTYLQQSLQIQRDIGDKNGEGTTLNNLATTAHAKGDYATALTYLQQSLQIQRDIGDKKGEGTTLNNLSQIYDAKGDYDTALTYLQQSLQIQRDIGDKKGEGTTLNNLSQIYNARGDYDTALTYLQQSLQIQRDIGDKAGMIPTLHNMAYIALQQGEGQQAEQYWAEAFQLAQETSNAQGLFAVGRDFGQLLAANGAAEQGVPLLETAAQVGRAAGLPGTEQVEALLSAARAAQAPATQAPAAAHGATEGAE